MITVAGADRVLTMDLHQGQIQGFFNIPVDELTAVHLLSNYFRQKQLEDLVVVTDLGFAKRARTFAELLDAPLAIIEKRRVGNLDRAEVMNVIGEVAGKRAIIVDDEIDTAGTLIEIVRALEREGVDEIYACATHGVLSDPAVERIAASRLREVVLTDSIPLPPREADAARSRRCRSRRSSARRSADPPRRVRGRALHQRGLLHPGDAAVGGRGRRGRRSSGAAMRRTATASGGCREAESSRPPASGSDRRREAYERPRGSDDPPAPPPRPQGRARGTDVDDANWRRRCAPRGGTLPPLKQPRDEPDLDARVGAFWLGPRRADVRPPRRRLRQRASGRSRADAGPHGPRRRSPTGAARCRRPLDLY